MKKLCLSLSLHPPPILSLKMLCLRVAHSSFHYTVELALTLARWKRKKATRKHFSVFEGILNLLITWYFFSGVSTCFVEMKRSSENVGKISLEKCGKELLTHRWYRDFLFCGFLIKFGWCGNWRLIIASHWQEKSQLRLEKKMVRISSSDYSALSAQLSSSSCPSKNREFQSCVLHVIFHFASISFILSNIYISSPVLLTQWKGRAAALRPLRMKSTAAANAQIPNKWNILFLYYVLYVIFFCSVENAKDLCLRLIATKNN